MLSTMQDVPLTVARIMRHGTTVHGSSEVVTWTGDSEPRRTSYAEVGRRVAGLAHALRELGVTGDQRVATFLWNNQEHLECYLAVPSMGAVLHTLNLRLPADQLLYIVEHADDRVLVLDGSLVPLFAPALPALRTVEHIVVTGDADIAPLEGHGKTIHRYEELIAGRPTAFAWRDDIDEREAAALCYTSGTTGNPKGVAYSHRSTYLHSMQICTVEGFGIGPHDRLLPVVPMFHVNAWGLPYGAMLSGASILMPDRFLQAEPLAAMIAAEKPTIAAAVPTIWSALLDHLDHHPTDVSSLREVVVGGAACPPALMEAFEQRHGVRIVHAWGMTETSPLGAVARPPAGVAPERERAYRVTQGRLPASVQGRLVGPDGSLMPHDGESVGELEVRGPWIAGAYLGGETGDDSAEGDRFHDGWLRTGDVGTLTPDGFLTLTDRAKDVIKSGGEWISSVALENHLMAHPDVAEAAVVGVPDEKWGERPLATVVLRPEAGVGPAELKEFLAERVPRWQVPERWSLIAEVPKTSVGKFDKKVIRRRFGEGALEVERI